MTVLLVALGAGVGAPLRYWVAGLLDRRLPVGTLVVNVVGSFLLGFFAALSLQEQAWALLATGFCGGLTTYSAFAVQTVALGARPLRAVAYAVATVLAALVAVGLGYTLAS